jgi:hypothetical protein
VAAGTGQVKASEGGNDDDGAHIEEAGRLLDFAVGWVAAFPEDFKGDHPVIERMADQARRWQEAMRGRADIKQGVRAGRLVLRLEAAKVSTLAYAGGGDRMQSLLMRAGSHLRNVAAAQAASGRRRSLRVLVRQQATISAASLQQSASAHPVPQPGPPQHQSLPDLSTSGPLTRAHTTHTTRHDTHDTARPDRFWLTDVCVRVQRYRASTRWTSWRSTRARSRGS